MKIAQIVCLPKTEDTEIKKGPKPVKPNYEVGTIVRDRRKSVSQPQDYGKVEAIKGNKVKIVWNFDSKDKRREEVFDMVEDTELLSLIVSEA